MTNEEVRKAAKKIVEEVLGDIESIIDDVHDDDGYFYHALEHGHRYLSKSMIEKNILGIIYYYDRGIYKGEEEDDET